MRKIISASLSEFLVTGVFAVAFSVDGCEWMQGVVFLYVRFVFVCFVLFWLFNGIDSNHIAEQSPEEKIIEKMTGIHSIVRSGLLASFGRPWFALFYAFAGMIGYAMRPRFDHLSRVDD